MYIKLFKKYNWFGICFEEKSLLGFLVDHISISILTIILKDISYDLHFVDEKI